jgi:hypothetical protein
MKESYDEGVASHIDPESCAEDRKALSEALTGARAGRVWSRVILLKSGEPTWWDEAEGNNGCIDNARGIHSLCGRRPQARTETPCTGVGRFHDCLCSQGDRGCIGKSEDASQ